MDRYSKEYSGLLLCTKGHVVLDIEGTIITVSEKELIGIKPFIFIQEKEITDDCEVAILGIHNNLLPQVTEKIKTYNPLNLIRLDDFSKASISTEQMQHINEIMTLFNNELNNENSIFKFQKMNAIFTLLIYEVIEIFTEKNLQKIENLSRAQIITSQFFNLLNTNINQQKGVEYFAEKLNITPKHLIHSVKTITKETPRKLINKMVLTEAKKRLENSDTCIQKIADELGFSDASSFTKFFKRQQGISPKDFRSFAKLG